MTDDEFWDAIALVRADLLKDDDEDGAMADLHEHLVTLREPEILSFADHLAAALHALDTREHCDHAGEAAESEDAFLFARCWVVAMGRKAYEMVKADPSKMPTSFDQWCEPLLYAAPDAWAAVTRKRPTDYAHVSPVSYESGSNAARWR